MKRTKFPARKKQPDVPFNLIRSIAWKFWRTSKVDWNELFSQACWAYAESLRTYNPSKKASPTTWAYIWMHSELINFVKKETRTQSIPNIEWVEDKEDPSYEFFNEIDLPEDCAFIVDMITTNAIRYALPPRKALSLVKKDLKEREGWSWFRIMNNISILQEKVLNPKSSDEMKTDLILSV